MYARKRLDISWLDLLSGGAACGYALERRARARRIETWFASQGGALACLSVRTGLDLYFQALDLPKGSEVLMSALTIPDMWKIVEHHGLVPVPIDVDPKTLAPRVELLDKAATRKTRALIVAHLFGARFPLEPYLEVARERGWLVLEDCAQAFTGADYKGHPGADVSMFSFGPIKTATALAGGVLCVKDQAVLERMRVLESAYPTQERGAYTQRVLKYACLKAVSTPPLYSAFVRICAAAGTDHDRVIQGSVRGFAGGEFFAKIRRQPSAPLLALMERRISNFDGWRVRKRTEASERLLALLPDAVEVPGRATAYQSYWVFTLLCDHPAELVASLRDAGFDATQVASLTAVPVPAGRNDLDPREARLALSRMVYLPVYPELPVRKLTELAAIVRHSTRGAGVESRTDVGVTRMA